MERILEALGFDTVKDLILGAGCLVAMAIATYNIGYLIGGTII